MKYIYILLSLLLFSCSDEIINTEVNNAPKIEYNFTKYNEDAIVDIGNEIIILAINRNDIYTPIALYQTYINDSYNINTIMELIKCYDKQPSFSDTIGDMEIYELWSDMMESIRNSY